jgi:methyl-accepting chemotaxis protein
MKISTKIFLGFGILIIIVWVIGIFSITSFRYSGKLFNKMDNDTIPTLLSMAEMSQKVAEAHVEFMEFLLSGKIGSRDNVAAITRNLQSLARDHLEYEKTKRDEDNTVAEELLQKIQIFTAAAVDVMDMRTRGVSDEELLAAEEKSVRPIFDSMVALLAEQNDVHKSELSTMREDVKASQSRGLLIIVIIAVAAMIAGILLSFLYGRLISRPITNLTRAADDISKGDISRPVNKETNDEIGDLAEAFERMRVSLEVMIEEETE